MILPHWLHLLWSKCALNIGLRPLELVIVACHTNSFATPGIKNVFLYWVDKPINLFFGGGGAEHVEGHHVSVI